MIEEVRYYIPKINEFSIGFNYLERYWTAYPEIDKYENWEESVFPTVAFSIEGITESIDRKLLKVKYLNKEDLESLKWKHTHENEFKYNIKESFTNTYYKLNFTLLGEIPWLRIVLVIPHNKNYSPGNQIFEGKVKNINEFEKLMEQLGIK